MKIVIVGGGLAGLTLANVLGKLGYDKYVILEQAPSMREAGAGIQIPPNAMQVFEWLGLKEEVLNIGHMNYGNIYRRLEDDAIVKYVLTGKHLVDIYGTPIVQVNRQDLANLLESKVRKDSLQYSSNCIDVKEIDNGYEVILENGKTLTADIVVAADGIYSKVREKFFEPGEHKHSTATWRALIPREKAEDLPLSRWSHVWFGDHRAVVAYWVGGGKFLNFVGAVLVDESESRDWRVQGSLTELREIYKGVSPLVEDLVSRIDEAFVTDVYEAKPRDSYIKGNIALIGDAAHPMIPYLAAGAGQAIEDAFALGVSLVKHSDPLKHYDQLRCERGNGVQAASLRMRPLYHGLPSNNNDAINTGFESTETSVDVSDFREWLWGYDIVNAMGLK